VTAALARMSCLTRLGLRNCDLGPSNVGALLAALAKRGSGAAALGALDLGIRSTRSGSAGRRRWMRRCGAGSARR
jgi:hypothetical protein